MSARLRVSALLSVAVSAAAACGIPHDPNDSLERIRESGSESEWFEALERTVRAHAPEGAARVGATAVQ